MSDVVVGPFGTCSCAHQIGSERTNSAHMLAVRCFSCNRQVGHLHARFEAEHAGVDRCGAILDRMKLTRMCCRRMLLANAPVIEDIMHYSQEDVVLDESNTEFKSRVKGKRTVSCD